MYYFRPADKRHWKSFKKKLYSKNDNLSIKSHFSYETIDGQKRFENGGFNENGVWVVRGGYSYIGDDGVEYAVTYVADEQGYRAEGEHLPQQPDSQSGGGLPLSFLKF